MKKFNKWFVMQKQTLSEDKAAIEAKLQALAEVAQKLVQVAQQQADAQQAQSNSKSNDDVVDAEFEEVKDNK